MYPVSSSRRTADARRGRLSECVARHRAALRADTQTWGAVGYAYARLEDYTAVCAWMEVGALAEVQGSAPGARRVAFAAARRRLVEAAKECSPLPEDGPVVRVVYRAAVRRLGQDVGGLVARLWALGRQFWPVLPDRVPV